jgi:hypothetical protein
MQEPLITAEPFKAAEIPAPHVARHGSILKDKPAHSRIGLYVLSHFGNAAF